MGHLPQSQVRARANWTERDKIDVGVINMTSGETQEIRKEVVKALGEACKCGYSPVAQNSLKELLAIKAKVFGE